MKIAHATVLCLTRARWLELASERGIVRKKLALLTLQTATAAIPLATPPCQPSAPFYPLCGTANSQNYFSLGISSILWFYFDKNSPLKCAQNSPCMPGHKCPNTEKNVFKRSFISIAQTIVFRETVTDF